MRQRNNPFGHYYTFDAKKQTCQHLILVFALLSTFTGLIFSTDINAQEAPNLAKPEIVVPDKIAGVITVTAEQVVTALASTEPPILVDARISEDRDFGFIETSVSLPDIETNCSVLQSKITTDKNQHLMFYCNGVQCGRSVVSIKIALSCGYQNLSWFKGGFAEWKAKGYQYVTEKQLY